MSELEGGSVETGQESGESTATPMSASEALSMKTTPGAASNVDNDDGVSEESENVSREADSDGADTEKKVVEDKKEVKEDEV